MFPEWVMTACYAGIGIAIAVLLLRLFLRRRRSRRNADVHPDVVSRRSQNSTSSNAAQSSTGVSWDDNRLFAGFDEKAEDDLPDVPRVEPDEVPHVGTSDYTFGALTPISIFSRRVTSW